jgi:integrase
VASTERKRNGKYAIRWRDPTGRQRQHTVETKAAARVIEREAQRAEDEGVYYDPKRGRDTPLLETGIRAYLTDMVREMRRSTLEQRELSLSLFQAWVETRERTSRVFLDVLDRDTHSSWWSHNRVERGTAVSTANDRARHLQALHVWLDEHPDYQDWIARPTKLRLPNVDRTPTPAPTWEQMDAAVLIGLNSGAAWYGRLFMVARCTGLRRGQIMQLQWEDVDIDARRLLVRGELGKSKQERRGRVVPLAPVLVDQMAGWGRREGVLIVTRGKKREPHHGMLGRLWERTGYRPSQPAHAFRRGFISELARAGVRSEVRKFLVGHARGTHGDVYTDPTALWPELVKAVALVPPLTNGVVRAVCALPESNKTAEGTG